MQLAFARGAPVTISGVIKNKTDKTPLPVVNAVMKVVKDSSFKAGTITNDEGRFSLAGIPSGNYILARLDPTKRPIN